MNFDRPYNPTEHGTYSEWQDATAPELERLARLPEATDEGSNLRDTETEESAEPLGSWQAELPSSCQAWHDHLADMADEASFESCGE